MFIQHLVTVIQILIWLALVILIWLFALKIISVLKNLLMVLWLEGWHFSLVRWNLMPFRRFLLLGVRVIPCSWCMPVALVYLLHWRHVSHCGALRQRRNGAQRRNLCPLSILNHWVLFTRNFVFRAIIQITQVPQVQSTSPILYKASLRPMEKLISCLLGDEWARILLEYIWLIRRSISLIGLLRLYLSFGRCSKRPIEYGIGLVI